MIDDSVIFIAQRLVRESGYNLEVLNASPPLGEEYSRAHQIYKDACRLLVLLDEKKGKDFINSTWGIKNDHYN